MKKPDARRVAGDAMRVGYPVWNLWSIRVLREVCRNKHGIIWISAAIDGRIGLCCNSPTLVFTVSELASKERARQRASKWERISLPQVAPVIEVICVSTLTLGILLCPLFAVLFSQPLKTILKLFTHNINSRAAPPYCQKPLSPIISSPSFIFNIWRSK